MKKEMKKEMPVLLLVFCIMLFSGVQGLYASSETVFSLEELLDSSLSARLRAGERLSQVQFRNDGFLLAPRYASLYHLISSIRTTLDPGIMVETLSLYQKPAEADKNGWTQAELNALYNEAVAISTLQGIEYYSASRGVMRTFYEISSIIDGPDTKNHLPDPTYNFVPPTMTLYARQKDLTFGDNVYKYTYSRFPGALVFVQENLTNLTYGIFTAVRSNNLHSVLAMLDLGDHVLIYAVSMARAVSLPGMNDRISSSFSNRAEAILGWISTGADRAFRNAHQ